MIKIENYLNLANTQTRPDGPYIRKYHKMNYSDKLIIKHMKLAEGVSKNMSYNRQDYDELVSIAYEALVRAAKRYNEETGPFENYAVRWIKGEILNHRKKNQSDVDVIPLDDELAVNQIDYTSDLEIDTSNKQAVHKILGQFNDREQMIITDLYVKGLTQREVARKFSISQPRVHKIVKRLKSKLNREDFDLM